MSLLRPMFAAASPAGERSRLTTLIFHRVLPAPDPLFPGEVDAQRFDAICRWLVSWFRVLPLDEAARRLADGTLPARAACITFDDGYADNCELALPILKRYRLPATFFIATGFLDGGRMWNDTIVEGIRSSPRQRLDLRDDPDIVLALESGAQRIAADFDLTTLAARRRAVETLLPVVKYLPPKTRSAVSERIGACCDCPLPSNLMMQSEQVKALSRAGMQVGAHTVSHPIMAGLDHAQALNELRMSRDHLERLLDGSVTTFAYPNGKPDSDYSAESVAAVREAGFNIAVTTASGVATMTTDPLQIPRFTPWDRTQLRFGLRLLANLRRALR